MTEEQADDLLSEIISKVETLGLKMAGGFHPTTDADTLSSRLAPVQ
jgi:hypothetical protein